MLEFSSKKVNLTCQRSSGVEQFLRKEKVVSSNLTVGSIAYVIIIPR